MAFTVRQIAKGPALGDAFDAARGNRNLLLALFSTLAVAFIVIAVFAPLVGLLLLAFLGMAGVAVLLYSRKQVHGHGRLGNQRGQRR